MTLTLTVSPETVEKTFLMKVSSIQGSNSPILKPVCQPRLAQTMNRRLCRDEHPRPRTQ